MDDENDVNRDSDPAPRSRRDSNHLEKSKIHDEADKSLSKHSHHRENSFTSVIPISRSHLDIDLDFMSDVEPKSFSLNNWVGYDTPVNRRSKVKDGAETNPAAQGDFNHIDAYSHGFGPASYQIVQPPYKSADPISRNTSSSTQATSRTDYSDLSSIDGAPWCPYEDESGTRTQKTSETDYSSVSSFDFAYRRAGSQTHPLATILPISGVDEKDNLAVYDRPVSPPSSFTETLDGSATPEHEDLDDLDVDPDFDDQFMTSKPVEISELESRNKSTVFDGGHKTSVSHYDSDSFSPHHFISSKTWADYKLACIVAGPFNMTRASGALDEIHSPPQDFNFEGHPRDVQYLWGALGGHDIVLACPSNGPSRRSFVNTVTKMLAPIPGIRQCLVARVEDDRESYPYNRSGTLFLTKPKLRYSYQIVFQSLEFAIPDMNVYPSGSSDAANDALFALHSALTKVKLSSGSNKSWIAEKFENVLLWEDQSHRSFPANASYYGFHFDGLCWPGYDNAETLKSLKLKSFACGIITAAKKSKWIDFATIGLELADMACKTTKDDPLSTSSYQIRNGLVGNLIWSIALQQMTTRRSVLDTVLETARDIRELQALKRRSFLMHAMKNFSQGFETQMKDYLAGDSVSKILEHQFLGTKKTRQTLPRVKSKGSDLKSHEFDAERLVFTRFLGTVRDDLRQFQTPEISSVPQIDQHVVAECRFIKWVFEKFRGESYTADSRSIIHGQIMEVLRGQRSRSRKQAYFRIDWNPYKFLDEQQYTNAPEEALANAIIITGSASSAEATTTAEYLDRVWPASGLRTLHILQQLVRKGPTSSYKCKFILSLEPNELSKPHCGLLRRSCRSSEGTKFQWRATISVVLNKNILVPGCCLFSQD
ncbi:hypothetical protein IWX91DRAFT_128174 [Phyllosticta citricarpa]